MSSVSKILQEGLAGPILDEILDPKDYDPMDILKSYFREILVVARKYARPNVEFEDLVVEGLMGLLDAIERFDPEKARGPKAFRQLAIIRIKSYMFEYFLKNRTPYTIPNYMSRAITLVERLRGLISTIQYDGDSEEVLRNFYTPEFDEAVPPYLSERIAEVKGRLLNLAEGSNKTYEAVIRGVLKVGDDIQSYENEEDFDVSPEEVAAQREYQCTMPICRLIVLKNLIKVIKQIRKVLRLAFLSLCLLAFLIVDFGKLSLQLSSIVCYRPTHIIALNFTSAWPHLPN